MIDPEFSLDSWVDLDSVASSTPIDIAIDTACVAMVVQDFY